MVGFEIRKLPDKVCCLQLEFNIFCVKKRTTEQAITDVYKYD